MKGPLAAILATAFLLGGCAREERPADLLAQVGDRVIGMKELNRSYMLRPEWKRGQTELQSYLTQLDKLIIQKLYAQEGEKIRLESDSLLQDYLLFLKYKEMIKGLYRKEIRARVSLDSNDVRRLYEWSKKKVDYEYIFCQDSGRCAIFAGLLGRRDVGDITFPGDSSVRTGRQEGTKVGDLPPRLERLLFTSSPHEVRGPVRVSGGYVTFKVTGGQQEKFLSENEFILQRQKFEHLLTDRIADSLSGAYIVSLMQDKDLRLNAPVFWAVADHFFRRVKEQHLDPMRIQNINVTSDEIRLLNDDLTGMGDAIVATHREGNLTVRQLMQALSVMPGSLRPRVRTPENLKAAIGMIVRNQYLLKEAERQGMGRDQEVLYEYQLQCDEALAQAYYERRRGEVQVTPEEVELYKKRTRISEEQVFFKMNMTALARDAKTDSLLEAELPGLKAHYPVSVDTAKVRSMLKTPDAVLNENPVRMFVREIFQ
jgi:hypothetical protein